MEGSNVMTTEQAIPQVSERVLQKIKKALNLANAKNDHESHTAMLLAQQMMAKYGLEMEDVDVDLEGPKKKEVMEMYATKATKLQWWQKDLASVVSGNFRCYTYWRTFGGKSRIVFLGLKEDTQIAREVFAYAQDSIEYFSVRYLNVQGIEGLSERTKIRNDYIQGFIHGLGEKFKEQVEQNEWGLILVKDGDVVERHKKMKFTKDAGSSAGRSWNSEAIAAGYEDGKRMDHTNKALKG
jgi:hypothetical protein